MKLFGLFVIIAMAGQITAQRSDFVNYLLELQYATDPLHQLMTNYFAEARSSLSVELTALNDEAVHEITEGLRAVIAIRDRTEDSIAEVSTPENEVCINEATASWAEDLRVVGAGIQACADAHVDPIYERTEDFHLYLQEHNKLTFDVQNMVLNTFTDINPLTDAIQITPTVEARIDEIFEEFENTIQVEVERRLMEVSNLRNSVPGEVHACVDATIVSFNSSAMVILDAVSAC